MSKSKKVASVRYKQNKTIVFFSDDTKIRIYNFSGLKKQNKKVPKKAVVVGRGTAWGNPYHVGYHGSRRAVIKKFKRYARRRLKDQPYWLEPLRNKDLVCFCSPYHCHAEVIIQKLYDVDMGW